MLRILRRGAVGGPAGACVVRRCGRHGQAGRSGRARSGSSAHTLRHAHRQLQAQGLPAGRHSGRRSRHFGVQHPFHRQGEGWRRGGRVAVFGPQGLRDRLRLFRRAGRRFAGDTQPVGSRRFCVPVALPRGLSSACHALIHSRIQAAGPVGAFGRRGHPRPHHRP